MIAKELVKSAFGTFGNESGFVTATRARLCIDDA
jgi:hypothetical protein